MTDNILYATFVRERETKNTVRFQEVADSDEPIIGTLYVRKSALAANGMSDVRFLEVAIQDATEDPDA